MANSVKKHINLVGGSSSTPASKPKRTKSKSKTRASKGAKVGKLSLRKDSRVSK